MNIIKYSLNWYIDVFTETNHEDMNESILDQGGIFTIKFIILIYIIF